MHDRSARLFTGLGALVVVWIVVYWAWPVDEPSVTTAQFGGDVAIGGGDTLGVESGSSGSGPLVIDQSGGAGSADLGTLAEIPAVSVESETDRPGSEATGLNGGSGTARVIPPSFEDYVIKPGDMGWERISERVYGTRRHWRSISGANPLLDPRKLRIGMVIRVPVDPENVQGRPVPPEGEPDPATDPALDDGAEDRPVVEYTVEPGDTLSSIAKAFYGSVRHVDFLYESNRDRLASKDDLRLGQVLLVPPLPAEVSD